MVGVCSNGVLLGGVPRTGCSVSRMCRRTTRSLGSISVRLMKLKGTRRLSRRLRCAKSVDMALDGDRFGNFEQRLVAHLRGLRTERFGGWHQGAEPAAPTLPRAGA